MSDTNNHFNLCRLTGTQQVTESMVANPKYVRALHKFTFGLAL